MTKSLPLCFYFRHIDAIRTKGGKPIGDFTYKSAIGVTQDVGWIDDADPFENTDVSRKSLREVEKINN